MKRKGNPDLLSARDEVQGVRSAGTETYIIAKPVWITPFQGLVIVYRPRRAVALRYCWTGFQP